MSLERQARVGIRWLSSAQVVTTLVGVLQLAIMGRLLHPADFGLMAMALVIFGFAQLFADPGISAGIMHRQDVTQEQLSTLYWLNLVLACLMSSLLFGLAPFVAGFNETPALGPILRWLAPLFLLNAIGVQFRVLQQKALLFHRLATIDMIAALTSLGVGASAALAGWGALSLVAAILMAAIVSATVNLHWGWRNHRPLAILSLQGLKSYLHFGSFRTGDTLINYIYSQVDIFIVGRLLGVEALGLYSMARNLSLRPYTIFNSVFTEVAFPVMARLQDDKSALLAGYLRGLRALITLNAPAHLLIAVAAEPLVLLLLGKAWVPVIPLVRLLAVYWLLISIGNPVGSLLLATGRVARGFYWNCAVLMFVPALVFMGCIGMGVSGAAQSMLLGQLLMFLPLWFFLVRPACGAKLAEYLRATLVPVGLALMAVLPASLVASSVASPLASLILLVMATLFLQIILLNWLDKGTWSELIGIWRG